MNRSNSRAEQNWMAVKEPLHLQPRIVDWLHHAIHMHRLSLFENFGRSTELFCEYRFFRNIDFFFGFRWLHRFNFLNAAQTLWMVRVYQHRLQSDHIELSARFGTTRTFLIIFSLPVLDTSQI
ncbi:hypothetical protein Tcan_01796, partial [Toxocara canis]